MYRVFIADDESWILERLVTTIDWRSIGAEVVGRSMNGREAYEKISGQEERSPTWRKVHWYISY